MPDQARNARLPPPRDLYLPRINSKGIEFGERAALDALLTSVDGAVIPSGNVKDAAEKDAGDCRRSGAHRASPSGAGRPLTPAPPHSNAPLTF